MDDLLSTLGVLKQSEQASAEKILRDQIYSSIVFNSAVDPYLLDNVTKVKVEGLPKLSASSLRSVSKDVSGQMNSGLSDVDRLAQLIQERFVMSLIEKETKGKNSGASNRANIQSILHADLSSADRRPVSSEGHEERRAVKLLSMEDLKNQRRNDITNSYNYRRGSSGVPFADHKYSLNIHASISNPHTYAEKLDHEAIESLMEEARAENPANNEDGFIDVTQTHKKRTKSDFQPKKDSKVKPSSSSSSKTATKRKAARHESEDSDDEEAEFDENNLPTSSSSSAAAAPPRKLRARESVEVDPCLEQSKRTRSSSGKGREAAATDTVAGGVVRRNARVNVPSSVAEPVCPICNRPIEVDFSREAKRNDELAALESAEAVDKHVERCSRRRKATVGAVYSENKQDVDESVFHEKIVNTRVSGSNGNGGSGSSSSRSRAVREKGRSVEDAIELVDDDDSEDDRGGVKHKDTVSDDFEEELEDSDEEEEEEGYTRSRKRGDKKSVGRSRGAQGGSRARATARADESEADEQEEEGMVVENHAEDDEEYQVNEEEEEEDGANGDSDSESGGGGGVVRMIYASDDWEDESYVRRLQGLTEAQVETVPTGYGTEVNARTYEQLYDYQKEGCKWMFELYQEGVGGILGDEMGLGKTAQLCAHFDALSNLQLRTNRNNRLRTNNSALFLVVCPATVLQHWLNEFRHWAPRMRSVILHSISTTGQELGGLGDAGVELVLKKLRTNRYSQGITVITTFEGMRKHKAALTVVEWTAVCLDEGQKIRNPTADITIICKMLPAFHRMILSGTPIQNNLRELWSLFDFIYPGRIGQLEVFEAEFSAPIRIGGYLNASKLEYEIAIRCAATLQRIIKPYLLRRKKDDLALVTKLPPKTEQVLFCQISPMQKDIYLNVLSSSEVHAVIERRAVAFRAINTLRKLCNHPALMFHQGKVRWHTDGSEAAAASGKKKKAKRHSEMDDGIDSGEDSDDLEFLQGVSAQDEGRIKWSDSGKLLVLSKVLPLWHSEGHKVLIFTQTRGMLNIIESMVRELGFNYRRLDGSTPVNRRAVLIDTFNNNKDIFVMLLTTRTGGVGVSLTSANRVVVFDPDWNPMTDIQSRERAWRLGQRREVTIYRLITRGTIEEKIYQRQIFKLLLSNRILDNPKQKALFTKNDIKELFVLNDTAASSSSDTRSTVSGSSASSGSRMSLPEGGHVNIHSAAPAAVGVSSASSAVPIRKGIAEMEDGEVSEEKSDVGMQFDVEEYVQQALPTKLIDRVQQTVPGEGSSSANANAGSVDRDRRLLAALFNGEAITSVYDHDYLESHPDSNTSSGGNQISKETATNRAMAFKVVGQKLQNIANSNATAANRNNSADTRVLREVEHQLTGSEPQTFPRNPVGSSNSNSSSSGLVASLGAGSVLTSRFTGHSASGGTGAFSSAALLNTMRSNGTAALQAVPVVNLKTSVFSSASSAEPRVSVQQDITNRLIAMFEDTASVYNLNPDKSGPVMYTTVYIVNRFKDLGDQYAPMFKECLRVVATNSNGVWSKK